MATQTAAKPERTYGQILKSSVLVGGSSVANIVIGMVRGKAMAVLLGPAGVGLAGLYNSILDITSTVAGLGVNSSGVRQIAAAVGSGDAETIARTTIVLRRVSLLLGAIGAILVIAFSSQISMLTFGSQKYSAAVCLLSAALFFRLVSAGQGALIQGMRRISDLARMGVWIALFGAVITIALVYFLRQQGVVPALVCYAAASILISWRYSRKIRVQTPSMSVTDIGQDVAGLLKLGLAFVGSNVMTMGSAYLIRIMVLREVGFEGAGLYQSAWTIGGLYVGFILQAMGVDFYPRLTECANDNATCNRLVNEQTLVGLLLGGPGVLATLTLAPLVITIFYTAKFHAAVALLRWFCLGTILQVISWPMGFIVLAKGRKKIFLSSDLAWTVVYVGLAWICIRSFGLNGVGIAFFGSYVFHLLITYTIARYLSGFRWSGENVKTGLLFLSLIGLVFVGLYSLPFVRATFAGIVVTLLAGAYSTRLLVQFVPIYRVPAPIRRFLVKLNGELTRAT